MPTTNIIGYLWSKRQLLDLDTPADVLEMVADLQRLGVECVRLSDIKVLGVPVSASVQITEADEVTWKELVHEAVLAASVEDTVHMLNGEGA